ncbi:response regulator transcription factor [Pedococcus ginsenosidimutans]|uniref:Response regulator transcription factor n=1 Tax=Pedococcus ginsenosidimutans TaxID=490570 RepID=A0ABP8YNX0_9MICO
MTLRVIIAEDQLLMRSALRDCLAREADIDVVGEAANGQEALELAERLSPDVALLDIRMPVMDGVEATRRIVGPGEPSPTRVVVMTTFELDEYIVAALRAGASGFLLKDTTPEELVRAIRLVAAGDALLGPSITRRLLDRFGRFLPPIIDGDHVPLTAREHSILKLVALGLNNTQIASELFLAESSVKTHVSHLLAKLNAPDRVHLVIYAYESGLVRPSRLPAVVPEPGSGPAPRS